MPPVIASHPIASFYVPWAAAVAGAVLDKPHAQITVSVAGFDLPIIQIVLAIAGVLMSRPLAPRRAQERGLARQLLITAIMMIVAVTWVTESRPGALFTFVVAIGLGFSGYALVEALGHEIQAAFTRTIGAIGGMFKTGDPK